MELIHIHFVWITFGENLAEDIRLHYCEINWFPFGPNPTIQVLRLLHLLLLQLQRNWERAVQCNEQAMRTDTVICHWPMARMLHGDQEPIPVCHITLMNQSFLSTPNH